MIRSTRQKVHYRLLDKPADRVEAALRALHPVPTAKRVRRRSLKHGKLHSKCDSPTGYEPPVLASCEPMSIWREALASSKKDPECILVHWFSSWIMPMCLPGICVSRVPRSSLMQRNSAALRSWRIVSIPRACCQRGDNI